MATCRIVSLSVADGPQDEVQMTRNVFHRWACRGFVLPAGLGNVDELGGSGVRDDVRFSNAS